MHRPTNQLHNSSIDNLRWALIILSSILLGIWAAKETIALRNTILIIGTPLSIYYIVLELCSKKLKEDLTFWKILPLIQIGFIFFWIVIHYLIFSVDPLTQFKELRSTWLRAFLASIMGLGVGLALRNHPNRLNLLWLGIFVAFCVLYYQYVPRAIAQNKILVPDYNHYLFHLKINIVLTGTILLVGINGALLDYLNVIGNSRSRLKLWRLFYFLIGNLMTLWAFVFIGDSRNGIALSIILYVFWFACVLIFLIKSQVSQTNLNSLNATFIIGIGLCLILYFAYLQTVINKSWHTFLDDAKVAIQIDRYPHWQNPAQMGYPKREDGQFVVRSTYERVAWATVGLKAISSHPQGVGVLAYPYEIHPNSLKKNVQNAGDHKIATHSGWVELGLAFGIPILTLIFSSLFLTFIAAVRHAYPTQMTILSFVVLITCLYAVSKVSIQHGIEILFFLLAFLPALLLIKPTRISELEDVLKPY